MSTREDIDQFADELQELLNSHKRLQEMTLLVDQIRQMLKIEHDLFKMLCTRRPEPSREEPTKVPVQEESTPIKEVAPKRKGGYPKGKPKPYITRTCACGSSFQTNAYAIYKCDPCRATSKVSKTKSLATPLVAVPQPESEPEPEPPAPVVERRQRRPKQCVRCPGSFVPTGYQQPFCPSCVAAIDIENAEVRRQQLEADPEDGKRSDSETWPSSKVKGFPCGSCVNGKENALSESGFECTASCARACAPWAPAWKYKAKQ